MSDDASPIDPPVCGLLSADGRHVCRLSPDHRSHAPGALCNDGAVSWKHTDEAPRPPKPPTRGGHGRTRTVTETAPGRARRLALEALAQGDGEALCDQVEALRELGLEREAQMVQRVVAAMVVLDRQRELAVAALQPSS